MIKSPFTPGHVMKGHPHVHNLLYIRGFDLLQVLTAWLARGAVLTSWLARGAVMGSDE
jgi:hypothetical protein